MFSEFNKIAKSDTLLYDLKFGIPIINLKKTFDKFFARFTLVIVLLNFINQYKISNLCQILSK